MAFEEKKDKDLTVSVIIPVRQGKFPSPARTHLKSLDYPQEKIEVFIIEGDSPSAQRNRGAERATGEILYFVDDDSMLSTNCLNEIIKSYNGQEIGVVGGPNLISENSALPQRIFSYALSSYFAHGVMRSRYTSVGQLRQTNERELILSNLSIKRDVFRKAGGFNEILYPNEENELLNRIFSIGFKLIYNPKAIVYKDGRRNFSEFMRQIFNYGKGRMEQIFIEGLHLNLYFFIPLIFFLYLVSLIFKHDFYYLVPLTVYTLGAFSSAIAFAIKKREAILAILLPQTYLIMHISYAIGMLWGFIIKISGLESDAQKKKIVVEKIKAFGEIWYEND